MPAPLPAADVHRALTALGVLQQDFDAIRRVPFQQAQVLLQELKAKARRNYKRLALELHPDRTQGDETKAALFVLLGQVLADLDKLHVQPSAPQPPVLINVQFASPAWQQAMHANGFPWVHAPKVWATTATSTTASTSTPTTTIHAQQVLRIVKMRPR